MAKKTEGEMGEQTFQDLVGEALFNKAVHDGLTGGPARFDFDTEGNRELAALGGWTIEELREATNIGRRIHITARQG